MKKYLAPLLMLALLSGCEDANEAIDKAQDAANKAVDSVQSKMESVDLSALNLDKLGDAAISATAFAQSIEQALNADYSNPEALVAAKEQISNAYACLLEASSESTAEKVLDKVMSRISNEDAQSLIEKGVERAKEVQECVM